MRLTVGGAAATWRAVPAASSGTFVVMIGCVGVQLLELAGAECNDAADRIVRRYADRYPVSWNDFDAKAAHSAAELGQYFVTRVALHPVESAAVHRDDRALHVD